MKKIHFLLTLILLLSLFVTAASAFASPALDTVPLAPKGTPGPGNNGNGNGGDNGKGSDNNPGQNSDKRGPKTTYKGNLDAIVANNLTLKLASGETLTFALTDKTKLQAPGGPKKALTLADLKSGVGLLVQATQSPEGQLTALVVRIVPGKPAKAHHVGVVTAYTPGVNITIQGKDGTTTTYLLTADTKLLPAEFADQISVGASVTIIAPRDVTGGPLTASGIVLHIEDETDDDHGTPEATEAPEATKEPKPTKEPKVTATP